MAQNRKPPAFQEYAASMLANRVYRQMSLASRGLFYSMRLECWENKSVPSARYKLARTLGYDEREIEQALTNEVRAFFEEKDDVFICPELEDYRLHLEQQRAAQSEGGKKGAAKSNSKRKAGDLQGDPPGACDSLVKSNPLKSKAVSKEGDDVQYENIEWIQDYSSHEDDEMRH